VGEKVANTIKKIVLWVLVISNMTAIFLFSSQPSDESSTTSGSFTYKVLEVFSPSFRKNPESERLEEVEKMQKIFRKGAHFSIYALLGFLTALLLRVGYNLKAVAAPPIAGLYAATDEFHQIFVSGRTGAVRDVFIDFSGAVVGTLFAVLILMIIGKMWGKKNGRDC
jgi:VanZ family protein